MLRRKDKSAPFEIMGSAPPAPPVRPSPLRRPLAKKPAPNDTPGPTNDAANPLTAVTRWWDAAKSPVVLRLPRGYVVLIAVGVLALLVAAYWAGQARGRSDILDRIKNGDASVPTGRLPGPDDALWTGTSASPPALAPRNNPPTGAPSPTSEPGRPIASDSRTPSGGGGGGGGGGRSGDPRVPGLNYLILARYPADEARRLIDFLTSRGVAAFGVSADNAGRYFIIAPRGFSSEQWNGPQGKQYEAQLRELGNAWKQFNNNKGDDLYSMYFSRYAPPE